MNFSEIRPADYISVIIQINYYLLPFPVAEREVVRKTFWDIELIIHNWHHRKFSEFKKYLFDLLMAVVYKTKLFITQTFCECL